MTDDETQIRALIERWAQAVHAGDLDGVLADHSADIVMFDVPPPKDGVRGIDAYREKGFPEEWKLHHQGGSIGYTGRDYRTSFETPDIIQENQAFTWNPSITGSKSEDTILATSGGPILLTRPVLFPEMTVTVEGYTFQRPGILEK